MKKLFIYALSILFGLLSCSKRDSLLIKSTNFGEEIEQFQNLEFELNKTIFPDSLHNTWDSFDYLLITPRVPGLFRFTTANTIEFSPTHGFAPNTDYTVQLNPKIKKHLHIDYAIDKEIVAFHTQYLQLSSSDCYWLMSENNNTSLAVSLNFNYPVHPGELANYLTIRQKEKDLDYTITSQNNSSIIDLFVRDSEEIEDKSDINIILKSGFNCPGGNHLIEEQNYNIKVPSKSNFKILSVEALTEDDQAYVKISCNQGIHSEQLDELISFDPKVDFTTELKDNTIIIKGDFDLETPYLISIRKELTGILNISLKEDYTETISFGEAEPELSFVEKQSRYLSSAGERSIALRIQNIPKIKLSVFKVYENNIMHYLRSGKEWDYFYDDEDDWHSIDYFYFDPNSGSKVLEKDIETKSLNRKNGQYLLPLNLDEIDYSGKFKGIYVIQVESPDKKWLMASTIISISDLGLIAHIGKNNVMVAVHSIKNAEAIENASVNLISTNNQTIATVKTNKDGIALFDDLGDIGENFTIGMITARLNNDFNYLYLNASRVETSRFDVGGKRLGDKNYEAFIYSQRNLYRPGDSVFFNTILRDINWKTQADFPLKMDLIMPNGRKYVSLKKTTNQFGASSTSFYIPPSMPTGTYTFEVFTANDILLQSYRFSVEEFMPDRIKVETELDKPAYESNDELELSVQADNLFGTPAVKRNLEANLSLSFANLYIKTLPDYNFNIHLKKYLNIKNTLKNSNTDNSGHANLIFPLPDYKYIGILNGNIYTTVFDETGRPVNRLNNFKVYTQSEFFGIKEFDRWLPTHKKIQFRFAAVDKDQKLLEQSDAYVQIKRYYWETNLVRNGNKLKYKSFRNEEVVFSKRIIIKKNLSALSFIPELSGEYEIRISKNEDDPGYVSQHFYAYGWGDTDFSSFEVDKEGQIKIEADNESYAPGETAKLLFKAPFSGKLLVTIEQKDILYYKEIDLVDKSAALDIPIEDEYLPNIYITATAIRALDNNELPLTVAHGFYNLTVDKKENHLALSIKCTEKSRSLTKQRITVKSEPNTQLTVSVVDEGILQIKDFKTPSPYDYFYAKRALEVQPYDLYKYVFPELKPSSSFGGDAEGKLKKRINPMTNKRVKLVTFWSGQIKTDRHGTSTFDIEIPKFSGSLRVMAVGYKDEKFGSTESHMIVADPVVISTALPRFLSPGDIVDMPVTISNTTDKKSNAVVSVQLNGPLSFKSVKSKKVTLNANEEKQVSFSIAAQNLIGQGKVTVSIKALNETFVDETEITVRPPSSLEKRTGSGNIPAGKQNTISINTDFIKSTVESKLFLCKSPMTSFLKDLDYLVRYPFGCLEQTVSAAFPQLYLADLANLSIKSSSKLKEDSRYHVQQAIYKIQAMQRYDGSFNYWPSGDKTNLWATIYATHFLIEAKKAGFNTNENVLDNAIKYVKMKVKDRAQSTWYYYDEYGALKHKTIASREIFYGLFVLALENKPNKSIMNYYKSNLDWVSKDSRYMLAAAYALSGNMNSFYQILPLKWDHAEKSMKYTSGSFYSAIRDEAIALYCLVEARPDHQQIPILSKHLSEDLSKERYLSTQERAFALLALGKIASKANQADVKADIYINGKKESEFDNKNLVLKQSINNSDVQMTNKGNGNLYYFYELEGISTSGNYSEEDNLMMVRKRFYDRNGKIISANEFKQNDLVIIELEFKSLDGRTVENVAITDMLPACFEIENPRLNPAIEMNWILQKTNRIYPDYMDIRDDRITLFTNINPYTSRYYYMVRVVSKGIYNMGPVMGDAMYNGEYHSYWGAGKVSAK